MWIFDILVDIFFSWRRTNLAKTLSQMQEPVGRTVQPGYERWEKDYKPVHQDTSFPQKPF
jgi:hypothetical protein